MSLLRLKDIDPGYREALGGVDIKGLTVYSGCHYQKVGVVSDLMGDEQGYLRYFVVNIGFWIFGKSVLLPIGYTRMVRDVTGDRPTLYTRELTPEQVRNLPEFSDCLRITHPSQDLAPGIYVTKFSEPAPMLASNLFQQAPLLSAGLGQPAVVGMAGYAPSVEGDDPPVVSNLGVGEIRTAGMAGYASFANSHTAITVVRRYRRNSPMYQLTAENHPILEPYQQRLLKLLKQRSV